MKELLLLLVLMCISLSCGKSDSSNQNTNKTKVSIYTQADFSDLVIPLLKSKGQRYKKFKNIYARKATPGEKIETITADGLETVNTAKAGDMVVRNQTNAKEMYIMSTEKFNKRYSFLKEAEDGFSEYKPLGKVIGIELNSETISALGLPTEFKFIAPWGEEMVAKNNDYLVSPLGHDEVYRIARVEFFETYTFDEG